MELEKAIKILNFDIKKWEIKKQHLDLDISTAKINEHHVAVETLLNHLTKQDKMIELMALAISSYDGQLVINQYKDRNEVKAKFGEYAVDGTYEQYFEEKAEEGE